MKRSKPMKRTALERRTPVKKSNPERRAKRRKAQASKHRAYMRSETRTIVDIRAANRCEAWVIVSLRGGNVLDVRSTMPERIGTNEAFGMQCRRPALQHHHLTYARYGGNELPTDVLKVCRRCHEWLDKDKPSHSPHRREPESR